MTGRTNAANYTSYEFECSTLPSTWYNTGIRIAGVKKIALQYYTIDTAHGQPINVVVTEYDTVSNGVLTKLYACCSIQTGKNFSPSLKIEDGYIYVRQAVHSSKEAAHFFMGLYY